MMPMQPPSMADVERNARSRLGAMGMGDGGAPAPDEGKLPMGEVRYRQAEAPGQACATCAHFQPPEACGLVAGRIDPAGVCDVFEPAQPAEGGQPAAPMPGPDQPVGPPM